jgi:SRSO17 transposase
MQKHGPVVAWIIDDTGFPKQGKHSVGVARQYCGQLGKSDNCQAAVSLSVSTWNSSLPIAWRLYLPEVWCEDAERCQKAGVPKEVAFQTKPEIALEQIRQAMDGRFPWEWYWQMRVMGRAPNFALLSVNSDCNM